MPDKDTTLFCESMYTKITLNDAGECKTFRDGKILREQLRIAQNQVYFIERISILVLAVYFFPKLLRF
jgi:hypothetical protein